MGCEVGCWVPAAASRTSSLPCSWLHHCSSCLMQSPALYSNVLRRLVAQEQWLLPPCSPGVCVRASRMFAWQWTCLMPLFSGCIPVVKWCTTIVNLSETMLLTVWMSDIPWLTHRQAILGPLRLLQRCLFNLHTTYLYGILGNMFHLNNWDYHFHYKIKQVVLKKY